jgi:hypothetical protein
MRKEIPMTQQNDQDQKTQFVAAFSPSLRDILPNECFDLWDISTYSVLAPKDLNYPPLVIVRLYNKSGESTSIIIELKPHGTYSLKVQHFAKDSISPDSVSTLLPIRDSNAQAQGETPHEKA